VGAHRCVAARLERLDERALGLQARARDGIIETLDDRVRGVVATQLASVPFMVVLALSGSLPVVAAAFFLRSALMNMNQPLTSHFAMEMVPERDHAITNSLLSVAWFLSWTISADIGGALIERKGYTEPLLIAAALYGFNQNWHVEEERPIGSGEDYGAGASPQPA